MVAAARDAGIKVRGAVSCALGCPYQGDVSADEVEHVVRLLKEIGVQHVGIADTIGVGTPRKAQAVLERALKHYPLDEVSGHFHDTYGQALSNIYACMEIGVFTFDASVAGLGGCPYAKGATGNVATEDVVFMLDGLGVETGIRHRRAGRRRRGHLRAAGPPAGVARRARAAGQARQGVRAVSAVNDAADRPDGFKRVAQALRELGHAHAPVWLDVAARTSQEAADALGIAVGQIAKSVIFRRRSDDRAVLVIASGDRRVDEKKVGAVTGELGRADAQFVRAATGFVIGGVAPLAHATAPVTLIDRDLFRFGEIWAAAGHPNGVFKLTPQDLERYTGAPVSDVVVA